ncbi:hypothetical protein SERLADRAFT_417971 [Serpula lacrymans var. lacrymans S7.9]|uniref:Uncharacterized protein n=1 Tax=Serpula lacrymans var. lacrymans (strain S7.9) TaxID=578457 RepID=F8P977_SERL9|nr:uncharacterized protein SERLADRAFT_417971 [Serpula lacrymans var. lacrymans S7.9]EGO20206.1 hypothetical protein SERLADRAFT_417971 [Serpula lacrymans var. lacrymans S7.9]
MLCPVTHVKNANQHPGKILLDLQPKKCSQAEVAQEMEQLKLTKDELVRAMKLDIAAAAKVEDENIARIKGDHFKESDEVELAARKTTMGSIGIQADSSQQDTNLMEEASQAVSGINRVDEDVLELSDEEELVAKKKKKMGGLGIQAAIGALIKASGIKSWCSNIQKLNNGTTNKANKLSTISSKPEVSSLLPKTISSTACTPVSKHTKKAISSKLTSNVVRTTLSGDTGVRYKAGGFEDEVKEYVEAVKGKHIISANLVKVKDGVNPPSKRVKMEHPTKITNSDLLEGFTVQVPVYLALLGLSTSFGMVKWFWFYCHNHEFASEILTDFAYLYKEIGDDPLEFCGLFRSPFVLQTFAAHLAAVKTSIDVKVLQADGVPSNATDIKKYPLVGALAMSAAAVERAFTMWAERKVSWDPPLMQSQSSRFESSTGLLEKQPVAMQPSDTNWGKAIRYYATSIKALKQETMNNIVAKASTYIVGKGHSKQPATSTDGGADSRACLADI